MEELHTIPTMELQHPLKGMFVNDKIAKVLKELGFNEPCFAYYRLNHVNDDYMFHIVGEYSGSSSDWYVNYVGTGLTNNEMQRNPIGRLKQCFTAPLYMQVVDWLREKEGICINILENDKELVSRFSNVKRFVCNITGKPFSSTSNDYYEALEDEIIHALSKLDDGNEKTT